MLFIYNSSQFIIKWEQFIQKVSWFFLAYSDKGLIFGCSMVHWSVHLPIFDTEIAPLWINVKNMIRVSVYMLTKFIELSVHIHKGDKVEVYLFTFWLHSKKKSVLTVVYLRTPNTSVNMHQSKSFWFKGTTHQTVATVYRCILPDIVPLLQPHCEPHRLPRGRDLAGCVNVNNSAYSSPLWQKENWQLIMQDWQFALDYFGFM